MTSRDVLTGNLRAKLLRHDLDHAIGDLLAREPASAAEIATTLGVPAAAVRRRLRTMIDRGLIERGPRVKRRGVSEFVYSMPLERSVIDSDEFTAIPERLVDEHTARILRLMFRESSQSIKAGTFWAHEAFALLRVPMPLDDHGLSLTRSIHEELVLSIIAVAEAAKARTPPGAEEELLATANVIFFEAVPGSSGRWDGDPPPRWGAVDQIGRVRGFSAPLRASILDVLMVAPAGPADLAPLVEAPREVVRHELQRMKREGWIKVHSRRARRGTAELVFVADPRKGTYSREDAARADRLALIEISRRGTTRLFRDALAAARAGKFRQENHVLVRIPLRIDLAAFEEISALIARTLSRLFDLREEYLSRPPQPEDGGRSAISGLMLFDRVPAR